MQEHNTNSIFICHDEKDLQTARAIYRRLKGEGFDPWIAEMDLLPGQNRERVIEQRLKSAAFIIVLFSDSAVRQRGTIQREYRLVLETLEHIPEDEIFVIPVRIDRCEVPADFQKYVPVDLSSPGGFEKIVAVIRHGLGSINNGQAGKNSSVNIKGEVKNSTIVSGDGNVVNQTFHQGSGNSTASKTPEKKTRILVLSANPKDTDLVNIQAEIRAIRAGLRRGKFPEKFELIQHGAVQVEDLLPLLMDHTPHIVHFSGHGTDENEILLVDRDGFSKAVSQEALTELFRILKDDIQLVFLNACYSKPQADGIARHIDCVVGMSQAIVDSNDTATIFAAAFYQALSYGRNVENAFQQGQTQLKLQGRQGSEIPHLVDPKNNAGNMKFVLS